MSDFVSAFQPGVQVGGVSGGDGQLQASSGSFSSGTAAGGGGSCSSSLGHSLDSASGTSAAAAAAAPPSSATQMLRDFSLEIYDKKELQFMGQAANAQTTYSES
ncbi:hypothetical protein ACFX2C_039360 [Malus domestica]